MKTQTLRISFLAIALLLAIEGSGQNPEIKLQAINKNVQTGSTLDFSLLYGQTTNPVSFGITSQEFPDFPAYSNQAADDFYVPQGETWSVENLQINGFYSAGGGPVQIANVFFYMNNLQTNSPGNFVAVLSQVMVQSDPTGNLVFNFGNNPVVLQSGHYWLSVQPVMAFTGFGQWFWAKQAAPTISEEFHWQNPGGGWGLPNTLTWQKASLINWGSLSVDWNLTFAIYGTASTQAPNPFIASINDSETHLGESIRLYGNSLGQYSPTSFLFIDWVPTPVTFWSENEVYFDCPMLDVAYPHNIQLHRSDGILSNLITFTVYQPTEISFLSPNENDRITVDHLQIKVVEPVFAELINEVQFYYQPVTTAVWYYLGSDTDGTDLTYGTNNPIGSGDGWSYYWDLSAISDMTYTIKSIATDIYGNTYIGFRDVIIDYNLPGLLIHIDSSKLIAGKTVPQDYFDIIAEVDETEVFEIDISIKDLIGFDFERVLKKVDQDTVIVKDKNGVSISGSICGPTAAAVCLNWLKDPETGNLDVDLTDAIKKLAEKAKTTKDEGTTDANLKKAIDEVAKEDPDIPDDLETKRIIKDDGGLSEIGPELRDSTDVIILINQKYKETEGGEVKTAGHFVTVSSHHVYHGYEPGPPGSDILCMAVERQYIDFMDPGTGTTEYKEVEYWKKPPVIKDYNLVSPPKIPAGEATLTSTITVKKPKKSDIMLPNKGGVVYTATIPTNGQGIYHITIPNDVIPAGYFLAEITTKNNEVELARESLILTNAEATPFANFSAENRNGTAPFMVQFLDLSLPPDSIKTWTWDFGDGEQSLAEEPSHTYQLPGLYDVTLIASDGRTSDTIVKPGYIEVVEPVCQTLNLPAGWSGISSFIEPMNSDIIEMFSPVSGNLIVLYNFSDLFYPNGGIYPSAPWNPQSGYIVKMDQSDQISICGMAIESQPINILQGWNIIPVLSSTSVNVAEMFSEIPEVDFITEVAGNRLYWKQYGINSLITLEPGKSYLVHSTGITTATYPGVGDKGLKNPVFTKTGPWNDLTMTNNNHIFAFTQSACREIHPGNEIGIFRSKGQCVGMMTFTGNDKGLGVIANGDDPYTSIIDGFLPREPVLIKMYNLATKEVFNLEVEYDISAPDNDTFMMNGISVITQIKQSALQVEDESLTGIIIYPNPTNGILFIEGITTPTEVTVYRPCGNIIATLALSDSGKINLSDQPAGIYLIRISNQLGITYFKLVKEK